MNYTVAEQEQQRMIQARDAEIRLGADLQRLDNLLKNEDFLWWLKEHVGKAVQHEHDHALKATMGAEKCFIHNVRHDIAKMIADSPQALYDETLKKLQGIKK